MVAWRYEISLLMLKIFHSFSALTREIFFNTQREISYLRVGGHVISSIYLDKVVDLFCSLIVSCRS